MIVILSIMSQRLRRNRNCFNSEQVQEFVGLFCIHCHHTFQLKLKKNTQSINTQRTSRVSRNSEGRGTSTASRNSGGRGTSTASRNSGGRGTSRSVEIVEAEVAVEVVSAVVAVIALLVLLSV